MNVASIYPSPNGPGAFDNYTSTVNRSVRDNAFNVRIDHRAGSRDSFFVRYSYDKYKLDAPQGQAACCLPTPPRPPRASTSARSWPGSRTRASPRRAA
jgi:hypothetical protein